MTTLAVDGRYVSCAAAGAGFEFFFTENDATLQFRAARRGGGRDGGVAARLDKLRLRCGFEQIVVLRNRRRALGVVEALAETGRVAAAAAAAAARSVRVARRSSRAWTRTARASSTGATPRCWTTPRSRRAIRIRSRGGRFRRPTRTRGDGSGSSDSVNLDGDSYPGSVRSPMLLTRPAYSTPPDNRCSYPYKATREMYSQIVFNVLTRTGRAGSLARGGSRPLGWSDDLSSEGERS